MLKWDKENSVITDAQFGFRPGHSTVDAIFVLQSLINRTLKRKDRLYCCFIDYKKAFDLIDRSSLWSKLIKQGVTGKMLKIIKSLYENVKSCVKYNCHLSNYFNNQIGLFQGEVLSRILYSLYVNDCVMHFLRANCPTVEIGLINLFLLMYADDMVLIAQSPESLQCMLNALVTYNENWKLTLNVQKTNIVIFRNGGKLRSDEKWFYNGSELKVVDEFNYLGILMNYNGRFNKTQIKIAEQGRKALFALNRKLKDHYFNTETKCSVFDTYVNSILCYGSEVWGFHKALNVEKVHVQFCKSTLGVKRSTCNDLVYFELGRLPLHVLRKLKIIKYWIKIKGTTNCILKNCYEQMLTDNDAWIVNVKLELERLGLGYLWQSDCADNIIYHLIEQRFYDINKQEMLSKINVLSRGHLYQYLIDNFCMQFYLLKPISPIYKKCITQFRLGSHNLNIEQGRYRNEPRESRICTLCNCNDLEDEFHFILKCPFFKDLRAKYLKKFYYEKPSVFKLLKLLGVCNVKELCNLGKYLKAALAKRSKHIDRN